MRASGRVVGALAGLVMLGACGGGGGSSNPPPGGPAPTPTPTPTPGASTVTIVGTRGASSFSPNPASVAQGRSVSWQNNDGVVHRIVSNDGSFDTGNLAPGQTSAALVLATDGANYHCSIHPDMIGAINAASGAPPPCTGIYC